jgi:hypothetical protein
MFKHLFALVSILGIAISGCRFNSTSNADSRVSVVNNSDKTIDIPAQIAGTEKDLKIKPGFGWDGQKYFVVAKSKYANLKSKADVLIIPHSK